MDRIKEGVNIVIFKVNKWIGNLSNILLLAGRENPALRLQNNHSTQRTAGGGGGSPLIERNVVFLLRHWH